MDRQGGRAGPDVIRRDQWPELVGTVTRAFEAREAGNARSHETPRAPGGLARSGAPLPTLPPPQPELAF